MASAQSTSEKALNPAENAAESRHPRIRLPPALMELLEIAIFSFASISGLRSTDKVRGDPIIKGVCAMFAQLLSCASPGTMDSLLQPKVQARLGNWTPEKEPSPELLTLVSSKLKAMKARGQLSEKNPVAIPEALVEKTERMDERDERMKTRLHPRCWRCKRRCRFCRRREGFVPYGFRTE